VKYDQFPIERTWSEWSESAYAQGPIETGGRFGGNKTAVSSCQDCHMPDTTGTACAPGLGGALRDDLPLHDFNGANTWVLTSILSLDQSFLLYGPGEGSGLTQDVVDAAIARNLDMLAKASDMELAQEDGKLRVRIVNETGHKLPTGYGEGRRMWIQVRFLNPDGRLVKEHGAYDAAAAELDEESTKVYRIDHGIDETMAAATGEPSGPSFHFVLNNKTFQDNRIPPRGFTNAGFESVQAQPIRAQYRDGQHWDDTFFPIPKHATNALVRVWYQTTARDYIEFLRDENTTNGAGIVAYDEWVAAGKSAPALMDEGSIAFQPVLLARAESVSLSSGGEQVLELEAGSVHAGRAYWLLGSASGTAPGVRSSATSDLVLPLNPDRYLAHTALHPGSAPLAGSLGTLDERGSARAVFALPGGVLGAELAGVELHHAYVVLDGTGVVAVSAALPVRLAP
jgi:hypothetical protein